MSLDQNLFTLNVVPNKDNALVVDLVDPQGTVHYRKQREPGSVYTIHVFGAFSLHIVRTSHLFVVLYICVLCR